MQSAKLMKKQAGIFFFYILHFSFYKAP